MFFFFLHIMEAESPGGKGVHSHTSVVHMRDQRFSKHTLMSIKFLSPGKTPPKHEFQVILPQNLPLNKLFFGGGAYLVEFEK